MIIDHHNHLWVGEPTGEGFLFETMSVEALLHDMDRDGIDMAGVTPIAQDIQNEYVLEAQRRHPDRVFSYCMVNPRDKNAPETLRRFLGEGLKGLKLHPRLHAFSLGNHTLIDPLVEICKEFKVPVFAHGAGSEEFNLPYHFEEIARAFPEVPVIYGHMGSYNHSDDAILVASRNPNLFLDTSTAPMDVVRQALRKIGPDKILMSTDWPGNDFRFELYKIELLTENDPEARHKITGDNYTRMLKEFCE
jgi:uncharacterized protein